MAFTASTSSRPRVLSGMRPTGKLHLGNYMGALANWVKLQDEYECYFFIADWHALTTDYADPSRVKLNTLDVALDWLAAGLDPEKVHDLHSEPRTPARRVAPALLHDHAARLAGARAHLQGAAGEHHRQGFEHLRLSRLSAVAGRRYPALSAAVCSRWPGPGGARGTDPRGRAAIQLDVQIMSVFPEPGWRCSRLLPKVPGTDGRKMSKSYGNTDRVDRRPGPRRRPRSLPCPQMASGFGRPIRVIRISAQSGICIRSSARRMLLRLRKSDAERHRNPASSAKLTPQTRYAPYRSHPCQPDAPRRPH